MIDDNVLRATECGAPSYSARFALAMGMLATAAPPPGLVLRAEVLRDERARDELQEWAASACSVPWGTGIGMIDAAAAMADNSRCLGLDREEEAELRNDTGFLSEGADLGEAVARYREIRHAAR